MNNVRLLALATALVSALSLPASAAVREMKVMHSDGSYALQQSDQIMARSLAANTAESITVPTYTASGLTQKANYVVFSANCDFYTDFDATATVPSDTTDGTASEMNPTIRYLGGAVTTVSVITAADTCVVTAMFYR